MTARLGVILDENKNFIGLRELPVEDVAPESWLQKIGRRFRKTTVTPIVINTIDFIGLINWINTIKTVKTIKTIEEITNIKNIESLDVVDTITQIANITSLDLVDRIALIDAITDIGTINLVNTITSLGTLNLVNTISQITNIANVQSLDLIDLITEISNISSVDLIDRITLIDSITNIGTITGVTYVGTVASITNISSVDLIDEITKIGSIGIIGKNASNVERRSTISNHGATPSWLTVTGNTRQGKFFTRGCMGFIDTIEVHCKSVGVAGTITVYISPNTSLGYVAKADITVGAGAGASWRSATFRRMWLSDKLFIFVVCSSADIEIGYDTEDAEKNDMYKSTDSGASWYIQNSRAWIKAIMKGETEGDANVTGTVNTIEIPNSSSGANSGEITVPSDVETNIITVEGSGNVERVALVTGEDIVEIRFYIDGVMFDRYALLSGEYFTALNLSTLNYGVSTPQIQLMDYNAGGMCYFNVTKRFPFKRSFEVRAYHVAGEARAVRAGLLYDLIA